MLLWYLTIIRTDTDAEIAAIQQLSKDAGAFDAIECTHWADGGNTYMLLFSYGNLLFPLFLLADWQDESILPKKFEESKWSSHFSGLFLRFFL